MACGATLKRSLEFDPLHSPSQNSPKRRRCMPMTLSPSTPPPKSQMQSPFGDVSPKMTPEQIAANIGLEIRRMQRRRQLAFQAGSSSGSPGPSSPGRSSPSISDSSSNLTVMPMDCTTGAHLLIHGSSSSDKLHIASSSQHFSALSPSKRDLPLFTFKQVSLICERMLKDRECQIREEYNSVLTSKLAEQYEAFLKFNHDMLHRRFADIPASYVS